MAYDVWYSLRNNRIKQGCMGGFTVREGNTLVMDETSVQHYMFFRAIDGVDDDSFWGRFSSNLMLSEEVVCYIYVMASNLLNYDLDNGESIDISGYLCDSEVDTYKKVSLLTTLGAKRFVNTEDFLLYDIRGRYLYIGIEIIGSGKAHIGNIRIGARGDNFMGSFPEVYRERNSFFHRYLSILSIKRRWRN